MATTMAFPRASRNSASSSIKAGSVELVPKTAAGNGQNLVSQLPEKRELPWNMVIEIHEKNR
jgi:hypothetical protein